MRPYKVEMRNMDGAGTRPCRVWTLPPAGRDYWAVVTDCPCPVCGDGALRWAEAGYVPGYRICSACRRHFLADCRAEYPDAEEMTVEAFCQWKAERQRTPVEWLPTTEARFHEML